VFGLLVTLGLFALEIFGIRKCTALIVVGARLEAAMGTKQGQFTNRPKGLGGFISEPFAAGVIYPTVMAGWAFFTLPFARAAWATSFAIVIFFGFLLLTLFYIWWLRAVEIPRLQEACGTNG